MRPQVSAFWCGFWGSINVAARSQSGRSVCVMRWEAILRFPWSAGMGQDATQIVLKNLLIIGLIFLRFFVDRSTPFDRYTLVLPLRSSGLRREGGLPA
ncbi:hypothetical protein CPC08DRAFT_332076 [Agrocybe pediades]|nr:hypothetical protein CPC08DRAFT_332076 [Agrocybe pediades]